MQRCHPNLPQVLPCQALIANISAHADATSKAGADIAIPFVAHRHLLWRKGRRPYQAEGVADRFDARQGPLPNGWSQELRAGARRDAFNLKQGMKAMGCIPVFRMPCYTLLGQILCRLFRRCVF